MMLMRPLRSSAIVAAGYDAETRTMQIDFVNGRSYTHPDVPQEVYEGLLAANSPGRFYNENIKGAYV